jgi:hypothetical protein
LNAPAQRADTAVNPPVRIPLSRGLFALVDPEDAQRVLAFGKWSAHRNGRAFYACNNRGGKTTHLHRFVLGIGDDRDVDHRNTDCLDCRKANLRTATTSQNNANRKKYHRLARSSSRFKGVDFHRGRGWRARIRKDRRQQHIGYFVTESLAALAYDKAARELFGDFARVNFPLLWEACA